MTQIADRAFKPVHFTDLDGIRGLLALTVMLNHFGLNTIIQQLSGWFFCSRDMGSLC